MRREERRVRREVSEYGTAREERTQSSRKLQWDILALTSAASGTQRFHSRQQPAASALPGKNRALDKKRRSCNWTESPLCQREWRRGPCARGESRLPGFVWEKKSDAKMIVQESKGNQPCTEEAVGFRFLFFSITVAA